jgi:excisionase family DNA binding protein
VGIDRNRYLTIKEAAERSGYDYHHLYKLVKSGAVASLEITEHTRLLDWEDLQRYKSEKPQRKPHSS